MIKSAPLVSICIPVFNGSKYLAEALRSALNQDYVNIEVVISDDQSEDNSIQIIQEFLPKFKCNVKVLHHQRSGLANHLNFLLENASGKYIKYLFQDDILYPFCLSRMVYLAESKENIALVFCSRDIICSDENLFSRAEGIKNLHYHLKINSGVLAGVELISNPSLGNIVNPIGEPTNVLLLKSAAISAGCFNAKFSQLVDIEFWFRVIIHSNIGFIDENLCAFRVHAEQETLKCCPEKAEAEDRLFYKHILESKLRRILHKNTLKKYQKRLRPVSLLKRLKKGIKIYVIKLFGLNRK